MKFSVFQVSRKGGRDKNEDRMGYCYTSGSAIFMLADGIEVTGARLDNGLLSIDLVRPVLEPRIRTIRIDGGSAKVGAPDNTIDITARRSR